MLENVIEESVETTDAHKIPSSPAAKCTLALRVAVATRENQRVDLHFGHAATFAIYDLNSSGPRYVGTRLVADHAHDGEDKRDTIYRMIADCGVLLVAKIGDAPQEALSALGIESTNMYAGKGVEAALTELYAAKADALADAAVDCSDFQLLHAMFRVADLDRSVAFYTEKLGMRLLDRREHKKNQFSQAYLGYGAASAGMTLELVSNWQREEPYVLGDAFGHIAIGVKNITRLCALLAVAGVPMPRPPRAQRHGESIVAFIEDPDGHRIELIQTPQPE
jgi:lactoylglutathione lyase